MDEENVVVGALVALLERIGPAILVPSSQSGRSHIVCGRITGHSEIDLAEGRTVLLKHLVSASALRFDTNFLSGV